MINKHDKLQFKNSKTYWKHNMKPNHVSDEYDLAFLSGSVGHKTIQLCKTFNR